MAVGHLFLYFLACGAATFPLTLIVLRVLAGLSASGRLARRIDAKIGRAHV